MDRLVWYVAYGSNKVNSRLECYLAGGRPKGSSRTYSGARDPSPPRRSVEVTFAHRMFFAGRSPVWHGGGVAFVELTPDSASTTAGVAHLITLGQLADLVAQECGAEAPGPSLEVLPAIGEHLVVTTGRYDTLVGLEPIEGIEAVLITSSDPPPENEPHPNYLELVAR